VRACICYRSGGGIRRVIWFNESPSGIFLGYYGTETEHHHSVHRDGHRHLRTVDGKDLLPITKGLPIAEVQGFPQLLNASLHLPSADSHSAPYSQGDKADVIAMLDGVGEEAYERVSFDYYLLHRSSEAEFLDSVRWRVAAMGPHELALCLAVALEHFHDYKVAFTVYRPVP
jgi:hypothetical protein